jgi:hypothetical protein
VGRIGQGKDEFRNRLGFPPPYKGDPSHADGLAIESPPWACAAPFQVEALDLGGKTLLVILDQNPLSVDPKTLKDIKVMETIKEGRSI